MISKQPVEAEALARGAKTTRTGRQLDTQRLGAKGCAATFGRAKSEDHQLMEQVVERNNLRLVMFAASASLSSPCVVMLASLRPAMSSSLRGVAPGAWAPLSAIIHADAVRVRGQAR